MDEPVDRPPTELAELAELVHDLRQPVSALLMLVGNLQRLELPAEARPWTAAVQREVEELAAVSQQIARLLE